MVVRSNGLRAGFLALGLAFSGSAWLAADDLRVTDNPEEPGTDAYYNREAQRPPGQRQVKLFGKLWPPIPRPTGPGQCCVHKYHSAHYWPFPYNCEDRLYVRQVSAMRVDSGWVTATTLYDYHFDDDTHALNHAGRMHLRWILESAPVQRRMIHVQYGRAPDITELRVSHAREEAALIVGDEGVPPILVRIVSPVGRPASEIVAIRRAELGTIPPPRIKYDTGASGGSGQGGGTSGM